MPGVTLCDGGEAGCLKCDITHRPIKDSYTYFRCSVNCKINVKKLNSLKQCSTATRPTSHN